MNLEAHTPTYKDIAQHATAATEVAPNVGRSRAWFERQEKARKRARTEVRPRTRTKEQREADTDEQLMKELAEKA